MNEPAPDFSKIQPEGNYPQLPLPEMPARYGQPVPISTIRQPADGGTNSPAQTQRPVEIKQPRQRKPFSFALAHGEGGASIWHGCLLSSITLVNIKKNGDKIESISQSPIPKLEYIPADNLDEDKLLQTHLGWYGNVYGRWDADEDGEITAFEIAGPDEPEGTDIGELDADLQRATPEGSYYILIGSVFEDSPVDQQISSDIPWFVTILKGEKKEDSSSSVSSQSSSSSRQSSAPSSAGGSSTSGSTPGSSSQPSSKSTCIVRSGKHPEANTALFIPEMPREAVFLDTLTVELKKRTTSLHIDRWFVEVCEYGTFACFGYSVVGKTHGIAVTVSEGGYVTIRRPWYSRKCTANLWIYAIRKGFLRPVSASRYHQRRMPARNDRQRVQCDAFINSAYDSCE